MVPLLVQRVGFTQITNIAAKVLNVFDNLNCNKIVTAHILMCFSRYKIFPGVVYYVCEI